MNGKTNRDQIIIRTSILGIVANLFLAAFKATVGLFSHSIAIVLDAVNNLSDALSSVITIIGTKLAARRPDKKHPLGYGRIEYLSTMIIAAIVLYAGVTAMVESVKKIIHPTQADYTPVTLLIVAAAVVVKLLLGRYVKRKGEEVSSGSLVASGSDAFFDAILSASVLASAILYLTTHISLEAYVGVVISIFIIKSGIEMLRETLDDILGKRVDREFLNAIKATICREPQVRGAYDLILHSYGPERYIGSVHVEVPDTMTAIEIDQLERHLADAVYKEHGVVIAGVGIYAARTGDDEISQIRRDVSECVLSHEGVLQMHGFYADTEKKEMKFDVVLDYALTDRDALFDHIQEEIRGIYPEYNVQITPDIDA